MDHAISKSIELVELLCLRYHLQPFCFFDRLPGIKLPSKILLIVLFLIVTILTIEIPNEINYWEPLAMTLEYLSVFVIPILLILIKLSNSKFMITIGKNSFLLYLLHMQIGIPISNDIFAPLDAPDIILLLFKPLIVIIITSCIIFCMKWTLRLLELDRFNKYLGIYSTVKQTA